MTLPDSDPLVGALLDGRYRVEELIASGGMASVYRAVDTRLERTVALKVMRPHLAADEAFVSRFRREARSAARVSHPNFVAVFDQGEDDGQIFLAMEFVPGRTLREVLQDEGPLTPRAALDIMEPVLEALAAAHAAGLMHRDVKPENVILRDDGQVKVADFGLARAVTAETATAGATEVLGTLSYISPEQIEQSAVTTRSDVYSAGLILFELLTGRTAFTGDSIPNVIYQHLHRGVPAPSSIVAGLPVALDSLVAMATAKNPQDRPADAGEFLQELRHVRGRLSPSILDRLPVTTGALAGETAPLPVPGAGTASGVVTDTAVLDVAEVSATQASPPAAASLSQPAAPSLSRQAAATVPPRASRPSATRRTPDRTAAPRRRRTWIPVLLLALLLGIAAGAWWMLLGPGATTTVPRLAALTQSEAVTALDRAHLDAHLDPTFSETVAKGIVIASDPLVGTVAHRGDTVTVTVSKGPERYEVPDLVGKTRDEAVAALTKARLRAGTVSQDYSETVSTNRVISSTPPTGTALKRGAAVNLVLSLGVRPIDVPHLTGKTPQEAESILTGLGLVMATGEEVYSLDVEKGKVAEQQPATGTLPKGGTVTVAISKGPEMVLVPNVYRKTEAEAVAILEAAGFKVDVNRFLGAPIDQCTGQTPAGDSMAPKGSTVTITIV
ncbi:MAG: Stk1 family PASTA domain-containing Ser/Thr kinase [Tetrasphaera sp.]